MFKNENLLVAMFGEGIIIYHKQTSKVVFKASGENLSINDAKGAIIKVPPLEYIEDDDGSEDDRLVIEWVNKNVRKV